MQYVVYCDESRHDGGHSAPFMAIGSLWVPRERKSEISKAARTLFRAAGLNAEVKWSKVSAARLDAYKRVIDFFFATRELSFRVIVVEQAGLDTGRLDGGDRELGFYRFYYDLLARWLEPGSEYLILLDFKQNQSANRYHDLRAALSRCLKGNEGHIIDLTVIDSAETPLAQLCDLLTGAFSAAWCGDARPGGAKAELIAHTAAHIGWSSLRSASASPANSKVNVFRIEL